MRRDLIQLSYPLGLTTKIITQVENQIWGNLTTDAIYKANTPYSGAQNEATS